MGWQATFPDPFQPSNPFSIVPVRPEFLFSEKSLKVPFFTAQPRSAGKKPAARHVTGS